MRTVILFFCRKKKNKESHNAGKIISDVMPLFKNDCFVYMLFRTGGHSKCNWILKFSVFFM